MSNDIFGNISTDVEESTDVLGGGGTIESGVYMAGIKNAYITQAASEARALNLVLDLGGREYRETIYFTSGKAKGLRNYYERDGKKIPLPGFSVVNDLCLLATGKDLAAQDVEEKVVNVYDFDAKKEIPTKVPVITSLLGQKVQVGILEYRRNKTKKGDDGAYHPISEERIVNEINKVFHHETNKTVSEYVKKADDATFYDKWKDKNQGNRVEQYKDVEGGNVKSGRPGGSKPGGSTATTSLFGSD